MMQEFRSRIEDLVETEELHIRQEVAFGKYAALMPEEARQHPAKYNTELIEFLVEKYTQPGDVVADIMAGTGVLGVVAALRGRNVIQVELEPKYMEWMEKARENVERLNTLTEKGRIINLLGDSRRQTELLAEHVGAIITSPPFGDTNLSAGDPERRRERLLQAGHDPSDFLGGSARNAVLKHYGQADAVIMSPPYTNKACADPVNISKYRKGGFFAEEKLIACCITSPPFGEANRGGGIAVKSYEGKHGRDPELHLRHDRPLSNNPDNISNLVFGDITQLGEQQEDLQQLYKRLMTKKGRPTYLSEMLLVYKNMFEILRPGGTACVVVKPFIKDRKVVDLPYITWCLLRAVGFVLEKAYKWGIERPSFWRILYAKKNPDVPLVAHEYVVVVRKKAGGEV
jgi:tRNA G10  N-methylase Trm11